MKPRKLQLQLWTPLGQRQVVQQEWQEVIRVSIAFQITLCPQSPLGQSGIAWQQKPRLPDVGNRTLSKDSRQRPANERGRPWRQRRRDGNNKNSNSNWLRKAKKRVANNSNSNSNLLRKPESVKD